MGGILPELTRSLTSLADARTDERVLRSMAIASWSLAEGDFARTDCKDVAIEGLRTANWPLQDVAFGDWRKSATTAFPRPPLQPVTMKDPFLEDIFCGLRSSPRRYQGRDF